MSHIFISYVREDKELINKLCDELSLHGIEVWLDRDQIMPGQRWQQSIRNAIQSGAFFMACFSQEYTNKNKSYMNEELTVAIDEVRKMPPDKSWFIPVLISECSPPDRPIGGGETLNDLQWVSLYENWTFGISRIIKAISPSILDGKIKLNDQFKIPGNIKVEHSTFSGYHPVLAKKITTHHGDIHVKPVITRGSYEKSKYENMYFIWQEDYDIYCHYTLGQGSKHLIDNLELDYDHEEEYAELIINQLKGDFIETDHTENKNGGYYFPIEYSSHSGRFCYSDESGKEHYKSFIFSLLPSKPIWNDIKNEDIFSFQSYVSNGYPSSVVNEYEIAISIVNTDNGLYCSVKGLCNPDFLEKELKLSKNESIILAEIVNRDYSITNILSNKINSHLDALH